jgi:hypothetical protein
VRPETRYAPPRRFVPGVERGPPWRSQWSAGTAVRAGASIAKEVGAPAKRVPLASGRICHSIEELKVDLDAYLAQYNESDRTSGSQGEADRRLTTNDTDGQLDTE